MDNGKRWHDDSLWEEGWLRASGKHFLPLSCSKAFDPRCPSVSKFQERIEGRLFAGKSGVSFALCEELTIFLR